MMGLRPTESQCFTVNAKSTGKRDLIMKAVRQEEFSRTLKSVVVDVDCQLDWIEKCLRNWSTSLGACRCLQKRLTKQGKVNRICRLHLVG